MRLANERRHYIVTSFLIGWAHTQNYPCYLLIIADLLCGAVCYLMIPSCGRPMDALYIMCVRWSYHISTKPGIGLGSWYAHCGSTVLELLPVTLGIILMICMYTTQKIY